MRMLMMSPKLAMPINSGSKRNSRLIEITLNSEAVTICMRVLLITLTAASSYWEIEMKNEIIN